MTATPSRITFDPTEIGQAVEVSLTTPAGTVVKAYTTDGGDTAVDFPVSISQRTTYFLRADAPPSIIASVQLNGQEIAGGLGRTMPVGPGQGGWAFNAEVRPTLDTREVLGLLDALTGTTLPGTYAALTQGGLAQQMTAKMERDLGDVAMLVIGDSTSTNMTDGWVRKVLDGLAARYPAYSVEYHLWDTDSDDYAEAVSIATGTGANTLTCYVGAGSGWSDYSFLAPNFQALTTGFAADLIIVAMGHNMSTVATTTRDRYYALVESVAAVQTTAQVILCSQNARVANTFSEQRAAYLSEIAAQRGYGFIDIAQMWIDLGDYSSFMADAVHPNAAGYTLWADRVLESVRYQPGVQPLPRALPSIHTPAESLLVNPKLTVSEGAITGWALNNATVSTEASAPVEKNGGSTKIESTTEAATWIYQSVTNYRLLLGRWVTFSVRLWIPEGADTTTCGAIGIYDGTDLVLLTPGQTTFGKGGWRWVTVSRYIKPDATQVRCYIYADSTANEQTIYVDRASLSRGVCGPREIPSLAA